MLLDGVMEKKKSLLVTLVGWSLLYPPLWLYINCIRSELINERGFFPIRSLVRLVQGFPGMFVFGIFIPACIGILMRNNTFRKATVVFVPFLGLWSVGLLGFGIDPFHIAFIIHSLFIAVFFTRPKVKEQFK